MIEKDNENILKHLESSLENDSKKFNMSEQIKQENKFVSREPEVRIGYMEIYLETLPTKKLFYPKDARLFIRSAEGEEIKTWSMIDETDPFSVSEGLNSILSRCVEYIPISGRKGNWKDIKEEDRFALILKIRDMTFPEPENRLKVSVNCASPIKEDKCELTEIEIKSEYLECSSKENSYLERYYDESERCYNIKTKQGDFTLSVPSIGVMTTVANYGRNLREKGKKITDSEKSFINMLPYLEIDWRNLNDKRIKDLEIEVLNWNAKKTAIFLQLMEDIKMGPTLKLIKKCLRCGVEVKAPISFRRGLKDIFAFSDLTSEFL